MPAEYQGNTLASKDDGSESAATFTMTTTYDVRFGAGLLLVCAGPGDLAANVTDTNGNVWTIRRNSGGETTCGLFICECRVATGLMPAGTVITVPRNSTGPAHARVWHFAGSIRQNTTDRLWTEAGTATYDSPISSFPLSAVTGANGDIAIAFYRGDGNAGGGPAQINGGTSGWFSALVNSGGAARYTGLSYERKALADATPVTPNPGWTPTNGNHNRGTSGRIISYSQVAASIG